MGWCTQLTSQVLTPRRVYDTLCSQASTQRGGDIPGEDSLPAQEVSSNPMYNMKLFTVRRETPYNIEYKDGFGFRLEMEKQGGRYQGVLIDAVVEKITLK